jgi:malonyl-CoA/methylmalonyl-CoA synthetase
MLLSSAKFASKAEELLKTELDVQPIHLQLDKFQGGGTPEKVALDKTKPGSAGMMLYTSGTTNRPVRPSQNPPRPPLSTQRASI